MARPVSITNKGRVIDDALVLFLKGKSFSGWKSVNVNRSLTNLSSGFDLSLSDRFRADETPWAFKPGDAVKIQIGKTQIISGFIDKVEVSISAGSRTFSISGRDKTGDLIDCATTNESGNFKGIKLEDLAAKLLEPFSALGLKVITVGDTGDTIDEVTVNQGESVFQVLDKQVRKKGFLLTSDSNSNIVITRPDQTLNKSGIFQGENMISATASYDNSNRFSEYIVKGQRAATDDFFGEDASEPLGKATDKGIDRFRPTIINAESSVDTAQAQKRAEWEASQGVAKSVNINATVVGWFDQNNVLWAPNQLIQFKSTFLSVNEKLLIQSVTYKKGSQGTTSTLSLTRPDAYQPKVEFKKEDDFLARITALGF